MDDGNLTVALYAPIESGHHRRYVEAIGTGTPAGASLHVHRPHQGADKHMEPSGALDRLFETVRWTRDLVRLADRCDAVICSVSGTLLQLLVALALGVGSRLRGREHGTIVFVETHGTLLEARIRARSGLSTPGTDALRAMLRYVVTAVCREAAVRLAGIGTLHTFAQSAAVGSARLRGHAHVVGDPLDVRGDCRSEPRQDPRVVLLIGALSSRKGLDLAVEAWRSIPLDERCGWVLRLVGEPVTPEAGKLLVAAEEASHTSVLGRRVTEEEFSQELSGATAVLLPYRQHLTGSGILAALHGWFRGQLIASDYGVVGQIARENGRRVVRPKVDELRAELRTLLGTQSVLLPPLDVERWHPTPEEFARRVWASVTGAA